MTDKDIEEAVKKCKYKNKKAIKGITFCKLGVYPCERVIDRGQCYTLQKLFAEELKKESEDDKKRN